ncbi:hypothetical protein Tco_1107384 [Tanacetum coccineum]
MSANDNFSLHDDEELSLHDDASLDGSVPASTIRNAPANQPQIITTKHTSNSKLPGFFKRMIMSSSSNHTGKQFLMKERKARTLRKWLFTKDSSQTLSWQDDAIEIWAAIKTTIVESLEKGYDRYQKLLSQLDALGAGVSDEDANHKFLRSLPPAWTSKASSSKLKPSQSSGSYSSYATSSSKATKTATPGLADEVIHSFLATNADDADGQEWMEKCMWHLIREKSNVSIATTLAFLPRECKFYKVQRKIKRVEQLQMIELNHALMAFTVNNEVSMCSKLCLDSYNALQAKYDELQSEFGDQEAALVAHKLAVKKLESQLRASHKQQTSLTEKLNFQANQIFEKDEKLKKYRRIGMKAVKDKDALQKIVDSWCASSKNLWKLIDCGMSSTVKIGLGYGIQSNAEVLGYEEEISRGIFAFRETDAGYYDIPLYSRFKQVEYKGVPHPLSGDYTPREQEDIDDSLYEYGKYGPQPQSPSHTESDASSTVYSTCQSNDSDGEQGTVSDHSVNDDPIHNHIPIPSIEQVTIATLKTQPQVPKPQQTVDPSCAQHVKTPRQPIRTPVTPSPIPSYNRQNWNQRMERDLGAGYSFERKPCFVCGSLSHLIKDCDYYEKKMAREAALKSKRVVHADVRQATPAWTNTNRVNKANQFTPRPVQLSNIKPNLSTASKTIKTGQAADSHLPTTIWAEAVNSYLATPSTGPLGKFDEKSDEGFLVGYSVNSLKEVIDIDVQTEEAADLMVVSSTSLTKATRKAAISEKIAKKKTHSLKQPSSTPISKSADDIMTFRKELDALALKHLGPVPATALTSTNPVNTGSINLNTAFEEVTPGNIEAISPSADHEEEVFSSSWC